MVLKVIKIFILFSLVFNVPAASAHEVYFCGEAIPTERDFVANKLMTVIRKQIPAVTLSHLRSQSKRYFPKITEWLKYHNIPEDFKYIPIVECGFRNNLTSKAGAAGFWQLMPETAIEQGLAVTDRIDQRMNPYLSTRAACSVILQHYGAIKRGLGKPSWVLTAASYNFGPRNVLNAVKSQSRDYFNMTKLNNETAEYVYRLIAVKELFEHPELYMNGFGSNIFSQNEMAANTTDTEYAELSNEQRGAELGLLDEEDKGAEIKISGQEDADAFTTRSQLVPAQIVSAKKRFRDGDILQFELLANLRIADAARHKGAIMKGKAWLIDGRVYVDFGYGHQIELQDAQLERGISVNDAEKNGQRVALKAEVPDY